MGVSPSVTKVVWLIKNMLHTNYYYSGKLSKNTTHTAEHGHVFAHLIPNKLKWRGQ